MAYVIQLLRLVSGDPTPHDGRFLKAFDPTWLDVPEPEWHSNGGVYMRLVKVLETVDDPAQALQFPSPVEAMAVWQKVSLNYPIRPDGRSNRPLTAFHAVFEPLKEAGR